MTIKEQIIAIRDAMDKAGILLNSSQAASLGYLYKPWQAMVDGTFVHYTMGERRRYNGAVYQCRQNHDAQKNYTPDLVPALWELLNVDNAGSATDPIPYSAGMAIENGKYYIENDVIYLCIRDSVNPIYHNLANLIGQYVEVTS